jgi:hypothetical protein
VPLGAARKKMGRGLDVEQLVQPEGVALFR